MITFRGYLKEEVQPTAQISDGSFDVEKSEVREQINASLASVCSRIAITPYVLYNKVMKTLAYFHIILPKRAYLEGDRGTDAIPLMQYGLKMGMNDKGEFINEVPPTHFLFIKYKSVGPGYMMFAKVVGQEDLDKLIDNAEMSLAEGKQLNEISKGLVRKYLTKAKANFSEKSGRRMWYDSPYLRDPSDIRKDDKTIQKRLSGMSLAHKKLALKEDTQLDELSSKTLGNYIKKSATNYGTMHRVMGDSHISKSLAKKLGRKIKNREDGISSASKKLVKKSKRLNEVGAFGNFARKPSQRVTYNDVKNNMKSKANETQPPKEKQLDELSKNTLSSYVDKAKVDKKYWKNERKYYRDRKEYKLYDPADESWYSRKIKNRAKGNISANRKLTKLDELYGKGKINDIIKARTSKSDLAFEKLQKAKSDYDMQYNKARKARGVKNKMKLRKTEKPDSPYYAWAHYKGKVSEEALNELSGASLEKYAQKAAEKSGYHRGNASYARTFGDQKNMLRAAKWEKLANKREKGARLAFKKISGTARVNAKEETQLDELSKGKKANYLKKAIPERDSAIAVQDWISNNGYVADYVKDFWKRRVRNKTKGVERAQR